MAGEYEVNIAHSFGIEFDGLVCKSISEVSGLKMEQDVVESKQNTPDGKPILIKTAGLPKGGEVTLVRALTADKGFHDWVRDSRLMDMSKARRGGSIIMYNLQGQEIRRYALTNAWPKSIEITALKAGDNTVMTEKMVLVFEDMQPQ